MSPAWLAAVLFLAAVGGERTPGAPARSTAATLIAAMMRRYDDARAYQGRIAVAVATPDGTRRRFALIAAQGNGRGWVLRSRVEFYSVTRDGRFFKQSVRIDDGAMLWTWLPGARAYYRQKRQPDRLSHLLEPFFSGVHRLIPHMAVTSTRRNGRQVYRLAGSQGINQAVVYLGRPKVAFVEAEVSRGPMWKMHLVVHREEWNASLTAGIFSFRPPPGARRLQTPGSLKQEMEDQAP
ncbi:MAG: hypothetical protein ACP5VE_14385 [Chthonomonadales bacterium]